MDAPKVPYGTLSVIPAATFLRMPPSWPRDTPLLIIFFSTISQCGAALFEQRLNLGSHIVARRVLALLQAVQVIDAGTDFHEGACIACARPKAGHEISGNKAERERDKGA
jgi:hypothetical protein